MGDIVGGILGTTQADAAGDAADSQYAAAQLGIDEQKRQFDYIQKLLKPFVSGGTNAFTQQGNLIGVNGQVAEQDAIDGATQDPYYQALNASGQDAILQNASATGGLRGGNVQEALAKFSPQLLGQFIQQKFQNLGGISGMGLNAGTGVGKFGADSSNQISGLLQQQGAAQAGGALGEANANANGIKNVASLAGMAYAVGF